MIYLILFILIMCCPCFWDGLIVLIWCALWLAGAALLFGTIAIGLLYLFGQF